MRNLKKWISPAAVAVLAMTTFQARGAELTWTGAQGGANGINWNKNKNWNPSANAPTTSDTAVFAGSLTTNHPTVNAASSIQGVAFRSAGWTIGSGSTLTVGVDGISNTATTGTNTVNAAIALGISQTWTVDTGGTLATAGVISGAYSLTKAGGGTLILSGANTYGGGTILSSGTLQLGGANNRLSTSGAITVNGGTLNLGGFTQTTSGAVKITGGLVTSGTVTKTGANYDLQGGSVSAILAGGVGLDKTTGATATLTGTQAYTGATKVSGGTLFVNGSIASSSGVEVMSGATLGGSGTVSNISGAGMVGPGNSPGILTSTSVDGSTGLDFMFEFTQSVVSGTSTPIFSNASASGNDVLRLTGATPFTSALDADNIVTIDFSAVTLSIGDVYRGGFYADSGDFLTSINSAAFNFIGVDPEFYIMISTAQVLANFPGGNANGYITQFTVIPEPTTMTLFGLSMGGLLIAACRKKREKAVV